MKRKDKIEWIAVSFEVSHLLKDSLIGCLFDLGASGLNEESAEIIIAYFTSKTWADAERPLENYIASLHTLFPQASPIAFRQTVVEETDWVGAHRAVFRPQSLTHCFFLVPAWSEQTKVPFGQIPLILESGQAFGTGLHASTRLCLSAIESTICEYSDPASVRVLDVGTGTGILAIAAEKLGVGAVNGIDNDPLSIEAAEGNLKRNGCLKTRVNLMELKNVSGQFDIVVSNILLETHLTLKDQYGRVVAPRGTLILSGLLVDQAAILMTAFSGVFRVISQRAMQEWVALSLILV